MKRAGAIRPWVALLFAAAIKAAAHQPFLAETLPWLAVARGPIGTALLVLAAAAGLARTGAFARALFARLPPWPAPRTGLLFAVAALVYVPTGLYYTARLGVSGDEPHYLLMAQSLWRDHDLDLEADLVRGDWEEFTPRAFAPHYGAPRRDGRPFPAHSPGLPVLIAPAYALGGRPACVVLMALLAAALGVVVHALARRVTGDPGAALLAWAAAAGPPVAFYAFHLYTEVPSALALAASLLLLLGPPSVGAAALAGLLAAVLPWLHVKMIGAAAALGLVAIARLRGRPLGAFVLVAGTMAAAFLGYYQAIFGRPTPLAIYGGVPSDLRGAPLRAAVGLFLDRSFGLLLHAPVFLLALAGAGALVRRAARARRDELAVLAVGLGTLAPVLGWRMWWGGQCPPGRFLVPLVPVLAVAVAAAAARSPRGLLRWKGALVVVSLSLAVFAVLDPGQRLLLNRGNRPTRLWAALSADAPVERYLPSLTLPDPIEHRVGFVWVMAVLALLALDHRARRSQRVDAWLREPALALLLLVGIGAAVDSWARAGRPAAPPSSPPVAVPAEAAARRLGRE